MSKDPFFIPATPQQPEENFDDEIDLSKLLKVVWRGKWIVVLCMTVGLLFAADRAFRNVIPLYTATASVILEDAHSKPTSFSNFDPSLAVDSLSFETQIRIFKSRHLAEKVILKHGLLDDPYFNPYAPRPVSLEDSAEEGFLRRVGNLLDSASKTISAAKRAVKNWITPPDATTLTEIWEPTERDILDATIDNVLDSIIVSNSSETYVYDLAVKTPDPETSTIVATGWAEAYVQDQRDVKFEEIQKATKWLSEKVAELKIDLEASEAEFSEFKAGTDLISSEVLESQNRLLKVNRDRLQDEKEIAEQIAIELSALELGQSQQDFTIFADLLQDVRLSALLENNGSSEIDNRRAIEARALFLERQLRSNKIRSEQKQRALVSGITELEQRVAFQSEDLITLEHFARDVEANRVVYEFFLSQLKEVSAQAGMLRSDSRVLSTAVFPSLPTPTNAKRILLLGLLLGAFSGAGMVLLAEFLNNKFRTVDELEDGTGYLVVGEIPHISAPNRRALLNYIVKKPQSRVAESLRSIRTSLLASNVDKAPQVIMVTSAMAGEGKTSVSIALANSVAALEKKVLLVECDIRRRTFVKYFEPQEKQGLVSALLGNATVEECIYKVKDLGCDVIFADAPTINSADLFSSKKFRAFLKDMRAKYDVIILDTPPVLIVSDARVIGPLVDATLFVVRWNKTTLKNVRDALRSLEIIGTKVTGLVMTQVSLKGLRAHSSRSAPHFDKAAKSYYIDS